MLRPSFMGRVRAGVAAGAGVLLVAGLTSQPAAAAAEPTVPSAPTAVSARPAVNAAKIYFSPPASDGESPVTRYTVTSAPEGKTCSVVASAPEKACRVVGLTNGQAYSFDVTASNAVGTSTAVTTNSVTPSPDTTAPVLVTSSVSPTTASSATSTQITVRLRITDDISGRAAPAGALDANPAITFSRKGGGGSFGFTRAVTRISGDEYDGIYSATVSVPAGTPGGEYGLTVYPIRDNADNSTGFITRPGVTVGAPQPPTNVTTALDPDTAGRDFIVTWDAPADNGGNVITGYQVTDSFSNETRTVTGLTTTYEFPQIPETEVVRVRVVAVNVVGSSAASEPAEISVPAAAPSAPRNVTASRGSQNVTVDWDAPALNNGADVTSYTVTASPGGASTTTQQAGPVTISGLDNGTSYTFAVTATNSAGTSESSSSPSVTPAAVPSTPAGVEAVPGDQSARITWSAAAGNGASVLRYRVTASPGGKSTTVAAPSSSATFTGLSNGTSYTFTVAAINDVGEGPASSPSAAITPAGAPLAVTGVRLVRGDKQLAVSWSPANANGSEVTSYEITYNGQTIAAPASATGALLTGLTNGTAYRVSVTATNSLGTGPASAIQSGTPAGKPSAVAKPTAKVKGTTLTLTWKAAVTNGSPITSYVVTGGKPGTKTVAGGTRKLVFKNLKPGTYKLRVTAKNAAGSSAASPAATARIRK